MSRTADFPFIFNFCFILINFWVVYKSTSIFIRLIGILNKGFEEIIIIMSSTWNRVGELFSMDPSSTDSL